MNNFNVNINRKYPNLTNYNRLTENRWLEGLHFYFIFCKIFDFQHPLSFLFYEKAWARLTFIMKKEHKNVTIILQPFLKVSNKILRLYFMTIIYCNFKTVNILWVRVTNDCACVDANKTPVRKNHFYKNFVFCVDLSFFLPFSFSFVYNPYCVCRCLLFSSKLGSQHPIFVLEFSLLLALNEKIQFLIWKLSFKILLCVT